MVVKHNLQAMNANRMLGITSKTAVHSTEKLSSGYKINRAADDAAGLAISEKMRKQIRGLTKASANAEDGISAVQTAEGALGEVHDMLQRMNELCVQAANGTNSESDRGYIQDEIEQLQTEIDRIAETTKFNEIYLLKGSGQTEVQTLEAHDAGLKGTLTEAGEGKSIFTADPLKVGDTVKIGDQEYTISDSDRANKYTSINSLYQLGGTPPTGLKAGDKIVQDGVTYTVKINANATEFAPSGDGFAGDNFASSGTAQTAATGDNIAQFVDDKGNTVALTIKEGATLTRAEDGTTTKLVGSKDIYLTQTADTYGVMADGTNPADAANYPGWVAGDKIIDEDGVEYTYVAANGVLNNVTHVNAGFYKTVGNKAGDDVYTVKAGDTYIIKATGETDKISNGGIATIDTIKEAIRATNSATTGAAGTNDITILIQDSANDVPGKSYTIGVSTKPDGTFYTADDVANLVQAGNYVTIKDITGNKDEQYYALPPESTERNHISVEKAYLLMTDELKAASDIGADPGSESVVKNNGDGTFEIQHAKVEVESALAFNLHVGADADLTNKITIDIRTITTKGLGLKGVNVKDTTGNGATYALDAVTDALRIVSTQRSLLGATQNRLEHTISNLDNIVENTTAAESNIRDTDMADEMVQYANSNVLLQAGQSILAQANQANQGVLSLLQ